MGSFQASEGRWGIDTTLKRSKVEHNSYKFVSLGNSRPFARRGNYGKRSKCQKMQSGTSRFFWSSFSRDQRRGREKEREGKIPQENEFHMLKRLFI